MNSGQSTFFFCDVCDTLYRSNTTFDFVRYVVASKNSLTRFLFWSISSKWSPLFYALILWNKATGKDWPRWMALRCLKGMSAEELDQKATAFYSDFLIERSNAQVFQRIKKPGVTTILLSSSINPVIHAIAKANNFAYFSSEMEMKNGIATGNLQTDMTGRKHVVAKRLITEQAVTNFGVITDNHSDWELVKLAHDRWIVISTEEQKHFWKPLHPNFILIS
jgi:phosphoserine phosphatase